MNKSISRYMNTHICKYRQKYIYIYIDVDIDIDKIQFFFCVCVCVVGMFELQSWGGFRAQLQKGLYRWLGFGFKGLGFRAFAAVWWFGAAESFGAAGVHRFVRSRFTDADMVKPHLIE